MSKVSISQVVSCMDDYDPDALRVDKACEAIRACLTPVTGIERVATRSALGRVLAEDIVPAIDVPAHDNSAMDGYALRSADLQAGDTSLKEAGTALAGKQFEGTLGTGECVRVMTGAVMPAGADTVVIQEIVRKESGKIIVPAGQKKGQNVRSAGEDLKTGVPVLKAGHAVRPAELGLIASLGIAEVMVKRRLRVAFFSTGDELASIGSSLAVGQVYDSNRYTLYGMLARLGVEILDMGVVKDDPVLLENALKTAARNADVIITSGGVSVGEADFVKAMMAKLGEVLFWKIAMRPGRPMAFGRIDSTVGSAWLFGLPGNPVAVMVTFTSSCAKRSSTSRAAPATTPCPCFACPARRRCAKCPGAQSTSAASCPMRAAFGACGSRDSRVPGCCARCRRQIALSCWSTIAQTSTRATSSAYRSWKDCYESTSRIEQFRPVGLAGLHPPRFRHRRRPQEAHRRGRPRRHDLEPGDLREGDRGATSIPPRCRR